jgi:hypothetical protein
MVVMKKVLFFAGIAAAAGIVLAWGRVYWGRRVNSWATGKGLHLVSFRGAAAFEGPGGALCRKPHPAFRDTGRDAHGRVRSGWLLFGRSWNPFSPPDELVDEQWD